jgi:hypothetical protein
VPGTAAYRTCQGWRVRMAGRAQSAAPDVHRAWVKTASKKDARQCAAHHIVHAPWMACLFCKCSRAHNVPGMAPVGCGVSSAGR